LLYGRYATAALQRFEPESCRLGGIGDAASQNEQKKQPADFYLPAFGSMKHWMDNSWICLMKVS
jgi:hypothetical protein